MRFTYVGLLYYISIIVRQYNLGFLLEQVIPVWVINLKKRADRLEKIGCRLDELGIIWQRIDAIDGKNCEDHLLEKTDKNGEIGPLSNSTRACSASHYCFWQLLINEGSLYGVVLEDDVEVSDDFKDLLCDLSWIPEDTYIIKLEKFLPKRESKVLLGCVVSNTLSSTRQVHRMFSRHTGAAAYLMSRNGAKNALNWELPFTVPVDHLLFNETVSKLSSSLKPFILVPPIAWQSDEIGQGSDIDDFNTMHLSKRRKIFRSLKRAYYETRLWPRQLFLLFTKVASITKIYPK
jgi:glycosyl transferase, family 25